jgi:hypothetical protein
MKKTLLLVLLISCSLWTVAQETVADETTLTELKSSVKIETDNDSIFKLTLQAIRPRSYSVTFKKDRHGDYTHHVLYYSKEDIDRIKNWFSKL